MPWEILHYKISREIFEPEPGFEPRTSGFLARRSTTWAILVLMPAHVQISLLRRMPLLPSQEGDCLTESPIITYNSSLSQMPSKFWYSYLCLQSWDWERVAKDYGLCDDGGEEGSEIDTRVVQDYCIVLYWRGGHCFPMHCNLFRCIVLPRI